mmetsp:Transcript_47019/g.89764  ORF Transcript_47019/g.89764 Transcript_47019/m.89764 type:complete len:256 (-) Transcript_47019:911-1678(-)
MLDANVSSILPNMTSSVRSCIHSKRSSSARRSFPTDSSSAAHDCQLGSEDGSAFTAHLNSCRDNDVFPSSPSSTPQAWNRRAAFLLRGSAQTPRWNTSRASSMFPSFHSIIPHACQSGWWEASTLSPRLKSRRALAVSPDPASKRAHACSSAGSRGLSLDPVLRRYRALSKLSWACSNTPHASQMKRFLGASLSPRSNSRRTSAALPSFTSSTPHACHRAAALRLTPIMASVPWRKYSLASSTLPISAASTARDW